MTDRKEPLARRTWLGGAATAGAAAVAVTLLPSAPPKTTPAVVSDAGTAEAPKGYQLTDHVKQYYATARI